MAGHLVAKVSLSRNEEKALSDERQVPLAGNVISVILQMMTFSVLSICLRTLSLRHSTSLNQLTLVSSTSTKYSQLEDSSSGNLA